MKRLILALPLWAEFLLVVLIGLGAFILSSGLSMLGRVPQPRIGEAHLITLLIIEPLLASFLALFLALRGRRPAEFGLVVPRGSDLLYAAALVIAVYVGVWLCWRILWLLAPQMVLATAENYAHILVHNMRPWTVLLLSALNGAYEELLVCGYVFAAISERRGTWVSIHVSTALRLSYHLYQGAAVVLIIPVGLIFAYFYGRTHRLWPLIAAHTAIDAIALMRMVG